LTIKPEKNPTAKAEEDATKEEDSCLNRKRPAAESDFQTGPVLF
jgi:hypothetical protein